MFDGSINFGGFAVIVAVAGSLIWLLIGWRAMRAHERLSQAVEAIARVSDDSHPREKTPP